MKGRRLSAIPAAVYSKVGLLTAIPVGLLTLFSALTIPRLNVKEAVGFALPAHDPYQQMEERIRSAFALADFIVIAVESPDLFTRETVQAVDRLSQEIERHPAVASVISVTTARTIALEGQELRYLPLGKDVETLRDRIQSTPLLARFLLTRDEKAFNIYTFPQPDIDEEALVKDLKRYLGQESNVRIHMYGTPVMRAEMAWRTSRELAVLGSAALVLVFVVELLFARSLLHALLLWLNSMLPAAWTLGLFRLFRLRLETTNFFVPIVVLGLATSYGIHLFRYRSLNSKLPMQKTLDGVTPIIFSAAITTVVGFCSLLVSPIQVLRALGGMLMLGIALSAATALFFLPALMALVPTPPPLRVESRRNILTLRDLSRAPIVLGVLMAFFAAGIPLIRHDYRMGIFKPGSEIGRTLAYFHERSGGIDELELFVDTGEEYGLIDLELFRRIKAVSERLRRNPSVAQVICFTDFVEWANAGMQGADKPLEPDTEAALGETLELLSSGRTGLGIDRLVDPGYSKMRLLIRFGISSLGSGESARRLNGIRSAIHQLMAEELPGAEYQLIGYPLKYERRLWYLIRGLVSGLALYLPWLFLFLLLVFRSLRFALITMVPTVSAMILYLGIMGWFRIPLNYSTALSTAIVLGVSVDDVLVLTLFFRQQCGLLGYLEAIEATRRKVAIATSETTLIIVAGLSVLYFSLYTAVMHSGILASVSLSFATTVTLLAVPWLLSRAKPKSTGDGS
jgi:predicted RND superfamily exporter protein